MLAGKMAAWGVLGIVIKFGFVGMRGFVVALIEHHYVPEFLTSGVGLAFVISVCTNVFFGPQMMLFHPLEENLLAWRINFDGMQRALWTLLWFWIPAHTITFFATRIPDWISRGVVGGAGSDYGNDGTEATISDGAAGERDNCLRRVLLWF